MKKIKIRLLTKNGESLDEMIDEGRIEQALAFIEVELTHLDNEMRYLKRSMNKIKKLIEVKRNLKP